MNKSELPREIERKYLIQKPDLEMLQQMPDCRIDDITQTYLIFKEDGFVRRVRKRGKQGQWEYTYTRKKKIGFGERIELEDTISEAQYLELLKEADKTHQNVRKIRCCIPYENQLLEIDIYDFSQKYATLEIELPDIATPVHLPEWLKVIADVTEKKGYSNFALSQNLAFPEEQSETVGGKNV